MVRNAVQRVTQYLAELLQPTPQLLEEYARQTPEKRQKLFSALGVIAVCVLGSLYGYFFAVLPPAFLLLLIAPIAVMGLIVIWILPVQKKAPTGTMVKLFFGFFVVFLIWPEYLAVQLPGLPWISLRRMFLLPMCLALLIAVSTSKGFRRQMREYLAPLPLFWKFLVGFVIVQCVSVPMADSIPEAVKDLINYQTTWTAVFFVSLYAFQKYDRIDLFFKIFTAGAILLGGLALLEYQNQRVLWATTVPSFLQVDLTTMKGTLAAEFRNGLYRAKVVHAQPLPFAEIMALSTPILLYWMTRTKSIFRLSLLVVADIFLLIVLTLPQSRLGMVGWLAAHALFLLLLSGRLWMRNRVSVVGPAFTLAYPVMIIALLAAVSSVDSLRTRFIGGQDTIYSDQAREVQWKRSVRVIAKSPLFGYGPRNGPAALGYRGGPGDGIITLDNYLIWIALDYGITGFVLYYGMILMIIYKLLQLTMKNSRKLNDQALTILVMLSCYLLIKTVLSQENNHALVFIAMGIAMALFRRDAIEEKNEAHPPAPAARARRKVAAPTRELEPA